MGHNILILQNSIFFTILHFLLFRWVIFEERKTEVEEFRKRVSRARGLQPNDHLGKPGKIPERRGSKRQKVFSNPFLRRSESTNCPNSEVCSD